MCLCVGGWVGVGVSVCVGVIVCVQMYVCSYYTCMFLGQDKP